MSTSASRRPLLVGNWKMNTTAAQASELAITLATEISPVGVDVVVLPPVCHVGGVTTALDSTKIVCGVQNVSTETSGAFTGEIGAGMVADLVEWALVGHSERRTLFGEDDASVRRRLDRVMESPLRPLLAVGEALDVRQAGNSAAWVERQLEAALSSRSNVEMERCTIAYEPLWAIGTGQAATTTDISEMMDTIRAWLRAGWSPEVASTVRLLYGGSVTPDNAYDVISVEECDGALVGGASLKAASFVAMWKEMERWVQESRK